MRSALLPTAHRRRCRIGQHKGRTATLPVAPTIFTLDVAANTDTTWTTGSELSAT